MNLVRAVMLAKEVGAKVFGVVGRDGGYTKTAADACVVIPPTYADRVTPHTEGLCAVVWHLLVSHPKAATQRDEMGVGQVDGHGRAALRPAILLDRDGTLIDVVRDEGPVPFTSRSIPRSCGCYPKVLQGLALLREGGIRLRYRNESARGPAKGRDHGGRGGALRNAALVATLAEAGS